MTAVEGYEAAGGPPSAAGGNNEKQTQGATNAPLVQSSVTDYLTNWGHGDRVSDVENVASGGSVVEPIRGRDEATEFDLAVLDRGDRVADLPDLEMVKVAPAPMRAKTRKPRSKKVLDFTALKRAKDSNKTGQPHLPARGQAQTEWLKSILPSPKPGAWWECPADDKGFKIKLRWRAGGKKPVYPFARLGKKEVEKLKEKTYEEQKRALSGRIFRELYKRGDRFIAERIAPYAGSGEGASGVSA